MVAFFSKFPRLRWLALNINAALSANHVFPHDLCRLRLFALRLWVAVASKKLVIVNQIAEKLRCANFMVRIWLEKI